MTNHTDPAGLSSYPERTVQVPVSLPTREQVEVALLAVTSTEATTGYVRVDRARDAVLALLLQPNPTAEQIETLRNLACDGSGVCQSPLHVHGCYSDRDGTACDEPAEHPNAEPPRIEDLAPGTTFTACRFGGPRQNLVRVTGGIATHAASALRILDIDPSTIRDVTPPSHG